MEKSAEDTVTGYRDDARNNQLAAFIGALARADVARQSRLHAERVIAAHVEGAIDTSTKTNAITRDYLIV